MEQQAVYEKMVRESLLRKAQELTQLGDAFELAAKTNSTPPLDPKEFLKKASELIAQSENTLGDYLEENGVSKETLHAAHAALTAVHQNIDRLILHKSVAALFKREAQ
jgi:hypothetical protein